MTLTPPTPSAVWDAMSDQQKIEWLAVKVMGWDKDGRYWRNSNGYTMAICEKPNLTQLEYFDPLTDWNHWRQVEEKVMEDEELFARFVINLIGHTTFSWNAVNEYSKSTLPTRARALFLALNAK